MYDVIDTIVGVKSKEIVPASIVQLECEVQFTRYLPLEMPTTVFPKVEELKQCCKSFENNVGLIQKHFVVCGYWLNVIKREGLYRYCVEQAETGYTNFFKFCEEKLGVAKTTAQRLIAINDHFCGGDRCISEEYKPFSSSKLAIMATFENGLERKLQPNVTVKQLNRLAKYYKKHDWNVDLDTRWQDDLQAYQEEEYEERRAKSAYLHERKFEASKQEDEKKKKGFVSDGYKIYTKFFDDTLRDLERIENSEKYGSMFAELKGVLRRMQNEVLKDQNRKMLEGL